jgi:ribosomal protein L23
MIIKHPVATEKGIRAIESENTLVFTVDNRADKATIKKEIERVLGVKIERINTHHTADGTKRAHVRLAANTPAIDVATKLGLM